MMDGMEQKFIAVADGIVEGELMQFGQLMEFDEAKAYHQSFTEEALDWKDIYNPDNSKMSVCSHGEFVLFVLPVNVPKARQPNG